jgi:hypothetical protein
MTINLTKTHIDAALPKVAKGLQQYVWLQAKRDASDLDRTLCSEGDSIISTGSGATRHGRTNSMTCWKVVKGWPWAGSVPDLLNILDTWPILKVYGISSLQTESPTPRTFQTSE